MSTHANNAPSAKKQAAPKAKAPGIFRWKGVMESQPPFVRRITAGVLVVFIVAMVFTQLGFVGIGLPENYVAYAITILIPVALASLLFGVLPGTGVGLLAGALMQMHAFLLPMDYFELSFVTPLTSIVMLVVAGFVLGIFFALALRKKPHPAKAIIRIVIICAVVSYLYSIGFVLNAFIMLMAEVVTDNTTLIESAGAAGGAASSASEALGRTAAERTASFVLRLGDVNLQALVDALLMSASCVAAYYLARRSEQRQGAKGLRSRFAIWLSVVILVVFMATSAVSFVAISISQQYRAYMDMASELNYLHAQLGASDKRLSTLTDLIGTGAIEALGISEEELNKTVEAMSIDNVLEGYTPEEDGIILITLGDVIILSDIDAYKPYTDAKEALGPEFEQAIAQSLETGEMQRFIFDDPETRAQFSTLLDDEPSVDDQAAATSSAAEAPSGSNDVIRSHLSYLLSQKAKSSVDDAEYVITMVKPASMVHAERRAAMISSTILTLVLMLSVFALVSRLLNQMVARRIDETNSVLARITAGDLDARIEAEDTREFKSLASGINETVGALQGWIAEAESRMDAELATAKAIQTSALPRVFPAFPDITRFDIYASMHAAREVGGDFYDFFLIGDDCTSRAGKLGFVIADVSGKGVPAALFMMNAKALVRSYVESGMELGEAIENANRQLCDNNDAGMFVTVWVGVLDYETLHIDYVNAGHNPPMLWQDASWKWLDKKSGLPLGLFADLPYTAHELDCRTGDQLLLYTDGVTEAMNTTEELYGEDRLEALLAKNYTLHPRQLVESVRTSVALHAKGAEQSDDITILALEAGVPPEITATLVVPADDTFLPRVNEFIHTELDRRLCPLRVQHQLDIAVEELFVNVAHYAYPDATPDNPGSVHISYTYSAEPPSIVVDLIDYGIPYNPLEKPDAVTPDNIADVPIGGLGVLMAKRSVDDMTYAYEDGRNIVRITKKW